MRSPEQFLADALRGRSDLGPGPVTSITLPRGVASEIQEEADAWSKRDRTTHTRGSVVLSLWIAFKSTGHVGEACLSAAFLDSVARVPLGRPTGAQVSKEFGAALSADAAAWTQKYGVRCSRTTVAYALFVLYKRGELTLVANDVPPHGT